jgi:hypothetical protein
VQLQNDRQTGAVLHVAEVVYGEMLRQVCLDYQSGLPDARTLTVAEIVYWYRGLRPMLRRHTKPKKV